jgi:enolase
LKLEYVVTVFMPVEHASLSNMESSRRNTMTFRVDSLHAREVLDGRGWPTVEVEIHSGKELVLAQVPAGLSRGTHEAFELRDSESRYDGKGVRKAVANVNTVIASKIVGHDFSSQEELDRFLIDLDGSTEKKVLGANAILGVSLACAKAASKSQGIPLFTYLGGTSACTLPVPFFDVIGGGKLAGIPMEIQECILAPTNFRSYSEAMQASVEVYFELARIVEKKYGKAALNVGDDGGYTPYIKEAEVGLSLIEKAVEKLGYERSFDYALDAAATHFYDKRTKTYKLAGRKVSREKLITYYEHLVRKFGLISIEDPLYQDDFEGFRECRKRLKTQIVGDDFFATNLTRLKKAVADEAANALLLKINQIGTITEAMQAGRYALENAYGVMVSERSGEPEDDSIADIAVALNSGQIKTGAPARAEHTAKYNRLFRIEEQLGSKARYIGRAALSKLY